MAILVSNAEESSDDACDGGCPSWILHWENHANSDAKKCSVIGCDEDEDLVGAHVYREDEDEDDCYIIPLCRSHNHFDVDYLRVHDNTEFVPDFELDSCTTDFDDEEE